MAFGESVSALPRAIMLTEHVDRGRAKTDMKIRKRQSMIQYKNNYIYTSALFERNNYSK